MSKKQINVYVLHYAIGERVEEEIAFTGDKESCRNFIGNEAYNKNHGRYRTWRQDGKCFFDCGPVTYYTTYDIRLPLPEEEEHPECK